MDAETSYLLKVTKLDEKQLTSIIEGQYESLMELTPVQDDIPLALLVKSTIFKVAEHFEVPLQEKMYVAATVIRRYPYMLRRSHYVSDNMELKPEEKGQYYLVLAGMFQDFLLKKANKGAPPLSFYVGQARAGFDQSKPKPIDNVEVWVDILQKTKQLWK